MRERSEDLDCLKGVAILLVMFGHVQVHNHMTDPYLYDVIKSLQMPLFFLISGYLAGAGTKVRSLAQYGSRVGKRACAYLIPFFAWLVFQHASYVPRALETVLFQLDYGLWFLMALFLFTLLAYTAQLAQARSGRESLFWIVWFAGCAAVLAAYLAGVTFLSPSILIIYLPYYTAAYFVGLHPEAFAREGRLLSRRRRLLTWASGVVFLVMAFALDLVTVTGFFMLGVQTLASFLGCLWVVGMVLDWKSCRLKTRLAALGQYTLEIYVLHYQFAAILNPSGRAYVFWSAPGLAYAAAAFAVMSLITAVLIYLIDRIGPLRFLLFGKR
ncbi:MAG: acyltransferase family protein [Eubacteriales bacterium]|nr:acyltransferase family protein [Eubacteriales bacterium]